MKSIKPLTLGSAIVLTASMAGTAIAAENPFAAEELRSGYEIAGDHEGKCGEGKCGEGKCGEEKKAEGKCGEGKCGEGKCGGEKKAEGKCGEGKCGEGKCGGES